MCGHKLFPLLTGVRGAWVTVHRDTCVQVGVCQGERMCICTVCACIQKGGVCLQDCASPGRVDTEGLTLSPTPVPGPFWNAGTCSHQSCLDLLRQPRGTGGGDQKALTNPCPPSGQLCGCVPAPHTRDRV